MTEMANITVDHDKKNSHEENVVISSSSFFTVGCLHMFSIHKVKMAVDKHRKQHLHFPLPILAFEVSEKRKNFSD